MSLQNLKSNNSKKRKRVGRGNASGHGTYSCRGMNGQSARSGGRRRPGFEGGQTPYLRRMPKLKGFKNPNQVNYQIVNVGQLNVFDKKDVTIEDLLSKNLISKKTQPVKLLSVGDLDKAITITVHKASKSAIEKVEAKKGKVNLLTPKKEEAKEEKPQKTEK